MTITARVATVALLLAAMGAARAAPENDLPRFTVPRLTSNVTIDGDLGDAAWRDAARIETFYETNVSDNGPPPVRTTAFVAYDDEALYVAFDCADPDPAAIRAYYSERDNVFSDQDFAGILLDARNDRRSALELFVNAHGIQDDGWSNDATGNEDFSPDIFWDSAGRIGPRGWTVEMRIPFTSLRYRPADVQTMGILFYRNYPRAFRYQIFSSRLPRGMNCFICRSGELTGMTGLPSASHLVVAPYVSVSETGEAQDDGSFRNGPAVGRAGADIKWVPNADTAVDAALNPDFSQVESDTAQLSVNQRFALFYPEKRPFFLENVDLFDTPTQAVYTRTITEPRWGGRITGKLGGATYTALVADDRGGGTVIVPGPQESSFAPQDFRTLSGIARVRQDFGRSFIGVLATVRHNEDGSGNDVFGPDFQWRPNDADQLTVQYLYSRSDTPNRPDLAAEWDGRQLSGGSFNADYSHTKRSFEYELSYKDFADGFRADMGFVPRVGYREAAQYVGFPMYPGGFFSKINPSLFALYDEDQAGHMLGRQLHPRVRFTAKGNSNGEVGAILEDVRVGEDVLNRRVASWDISAAPTRVVSRVEFSGTYGHDVDVVEAREGRGGNLALSATVRAGTHLTLQADGSYAWLDVDEGRLFSGSVSRLRAVYSFSSRAFVRAIGQYVRATRTVTEGHLDSSLLFGYRLNWQSVLFAGVGDSRALDEQQTLQRTARQFFLKVSYAFQ